jgi:hypothetical protein
LGLHNSLSFDLFSVHANTQVVTDLWLSNKICDKVVVNLIINTAVTGGKFLLSVYNTDNGCVDLNLCVAICCVAGAVFSLALLCVFIALCYQFFVLAGLSLW